MTHSNLASHTLQRQAVNIRFKALGFTGDGIKPESTAPDAGTRWLFDQFNPNLKFKCYASAQSVTEAARHNYLPTCPIYVVQKDTPLY